MSNALDIACEMARHFESGKSVEEAIAALGATFLQRHPLSFGAHAALGVTNWRGGREL
jgi:hypothetical protein